MQAIIVARGEKPGHFVAEFFAGEACGGCQSCHATADRKQGATRRMTVVAEKMVIEVGMRVEVTARHGLDAVSALLFGTPIGGFFVGLAGAGSLLPTLGIAVSDERRFLVAVLALGIVTAASWAIARLLGPELFLLNVERVVASNCECPKQATDQAFDTPETMV